MRGATKKIFFLLLLFILSSVQLSTKIIKERLSSPTDPNPPHDTVEVVRDPIITWSSTDATSYDAYFGLCFPLTKIATVKSPKVKLPSILSDNTRYYWRIVARNIHGSIQGPTWSFETGNLFHKVLTPFKSVGPSKGDIHKSYTFKHSGSRCNQDHGLDYKYDWGDGTHSDWIDSESASHSWPKPGVYEVKIQARCSEDHRVISPWSFGKTMVISTITWHTKRLTNNPNDLTYPKIAKSGNYIHVIFNENHNTLCYKKSADGGQTWRSRQDISPKNPESTNLFTYAIAADGPYVHVVLARTLFEEGVYKLWYRRNTNYGKALFWGDWRQITTGSGYFLNPDIAVSGQYVHIVYQADWPGNSEIFYKRISNYGVGSTTTRRLTYSASGSSVFPHIATSSQYVYVIYEDNWPGDWWQYEVFFKRIQNYGTGTITTKRLTNNTIWSRNSNITAYGQYVFVVFNNNEYSIWDIFSKTIENYGVGTITTKRLTYANICEDPSVAFDSTSNDVQVAYATDAIGDREILWKVISNYGKGSYSTYRLTSSSACASGSPDILVQGGTTHIVYHDCWPGSYEIFYKNR